MISKANLTGKLVTGDVIGSAWGKSSYFGGDGSDLQTCCPDGEGGVRAPTDVGKTVDLVNNNNSVLNDCMGEDLTDKTVNPAADNKIG